MNNSDSEDFEEDDLILVGPEDVEDFNPANILPLSPAELEEVKTWLQPTPYDREGSEYSRHILSHLPGTGKWLTSTNVFQQWREGSTNGLLWIKGIPGSGKSVMAASVVNQLQKDGFPVIYFFFRQIIDANHRPMAALRDWLCQVLDYSPPLQARLRGYIIDERTIESLSPNDLWRDLRLALASLERVYCVTDALDEMDRGNDEFMHSLAELGQWRPSNVKVLLTSRPVAIIENCLRPFNIPEIRLEEHLVDADIIAYVQCRLEKSMIPRDRWDVIKKAIPGRTNGLFLYAKLSMDAFVESGADPDAVLKALPADLNVMYSDLLHEHAKRSKVPDDLQLFVLQFVTHAIRPLRLLEMAEIVTTLKVLEGEPSLKTIKDLVRATCGPLLQILPDETISVVHHSFTEFLKGQTRSAISDESRYPVLNPGPTNQRLAVACLDYLESGCLDEEIKNQRTRGNESAHVASKLSRSEMRLESPFLEYAAKNWYIHAQRATHAGADMLAFYQRIDLFLADLPTFYACQHAGQSDWDLRRPTLLHIGARAGLDQYIRHLLQKGEIDIESRDGHKNTALYWATKSGSPEAVRALLDHGADVDAEQSQGEKVLHVAATENHAKVVRVLLEAGCDPLARKTKNPPGRRCGRARSTIGDTPLMYACRNGHVETVTEFLQFLKDAEDFQRAFFWAVERGHVKTVRLILRNSAMKQDARSWVDKALYVACESGDLETIKELLKTGANPNIICDEPPDNEDDDDGKKKIPRGKTALHAFCSGSSLNAQEASECINLLIDAGADLNSKTLCGSTALHIACDRNGDLVKPLLDAGADPSSTDDSGGTVLHTDGATDEKVLHLLLKEGLVDVNTARFDDKRTPLHCRCIDYAEHSLLPLLRYKPDVNAVDLEGNTALHLAMGSTMSTKDVDALLAAGANPNTRNRKGDTPLHDTCGDEEWVLTLLRAGADIEARNNEGQTPIFAHCRTGDYREQNTMFQYLVESGARLDTRDFQGRTLLYECLNNLERFKYLLDLGLDPLVTDYQNNSLLFSALESSKPMDNIKFLIGLGLNVNEPNNSGTTVLHEFFSKSGRDAYFPGWKDFLDYILEICSNPNVSDHKGIQPLHLAVTICPQYTLKLLQAGADVFGITHEGASVLHIAARTRQSDIVALILSKIQGASNAVKNGFINKQDRTGLSALHYACRSGRPETVRLLLEAGADPNLKNKCDVSPFRSAGEFEIEQELWKEECFISFEPRRAAGFLLDDQERPAPERASRKSYDGIPRKIRTENCTTRLEEILELLLNHGARVTGKHGCFQKALSYAASNALEYTVDCLVRVGKIFQVGLELDKLTSNAGYLICAYRLEGTKKALRCDPNFQDVEDEKLPHGAGSKLQLEFSERLLAMRQYGLFEERHSTRVMSGVTMPAMVSPMRINQRAESVLHFLVEWGYKDLLARVCTSDMALSFDDPEWCSSTEKQADCFTAKMITPLLITACHRSLPNMDVIRFLVDEMKVNVNVKERSADNDDDDDDNLSFKSGALHYLAMGKSCWHVDHALPYLLERAADIEICDPDGKTPLHVALEKNHNLGPFHKRAAQVLLKYGANVNAQDKKGNNCLAKAGNDVDMVELLLSHGAEVNMEAILSAIQHKQANAVKALLAHVSSNQISQPDIGRSSSSSSTFLKDFDPEMRLLIATIDVGRKFYEKEEAREAAQAQIIGILLEHGADPYATYHFIRQKRRYAGKKHLKVALGEYVEDSTIIHHALRRGKVSEPFFHLPSLQLEHRDEYGCTLLLAASQSQRTLERKIECTGDQIGASKTTWEELLDRGANIAAQDNEGKTILHHIVDSTTNEDKFVETLKAIILRRPDLIHVQDQAGDTPLHYALRRHYLLYVDLLLENGADILQPDSRGYTALHHAAGRIKKSEWKALFQRALDAGVDINHRNKTGETPVFRYIIDAVFGRDFSYDPNDPGSSPDTDTPKNPSPFTEAVFEYFKQNGADFFVRTESGSSLLHVLASFERPKESYQRKRDADEEKIVRRFELLMGLGLDPMLEDSRQRTSLDIAAACGGEGILKLFERKPLG